MHERWPGLVPEQLPTAALFAHRKGNGLGVEQHLQDRLPAGEDLSGGGGGASQALVGRQQAGAVVGGEHPQGLLLLPGQLLPHQVVMGPGEGELKVGAVQLIKRAHRRRHGHQLAEQAVHLVVGEQQRLTVFIFLLFLLRLLFPIFLLPHLMRVQEKGVEELNELLCWADHFISVEVTEGATKVADQVPALGGGGNGTAFQRLRLEAVEEEEVVPVSGDEDDEEEGGAGAVVVVGKCIKSKSASP